jgi:hypothetical protein
MNLIKTLFFLIIFYFIFMKRKERFALDTNVKTSKSELDPTFYYKKGSLKPEVKNTISAAINNGLNCSGDFPQEVYIPIPKVPGVCKLPDNIQSLYVDKQETYDTCVTGKKTLNRIDDRVKFNEITTLTQPQYYANPTEENQNDCYSQLFSTVPQTKEFNCGAVNAVCRFNSLEALIQGNTIDNYNVNGADIRMASQW